MPWPPGRERAGGGGGELPPPHVHDELLEPRHHLLGGVHGGVDGLLRGHAGGEVAEDVHLRLRHAGEVLAHGAGQHEQRVGVDEAALAQLERRAQRRGVALGEG
ncbi:MAG TPA: hypothetical protein VNU26_17710, partial [Mycobacteriales bacterium]|nr:hypothetical protein [Mycobacteriales bacterium]